ncbi:MAG: lysophospholipid acyltransferase family protein [Gammaproteobacteria bacterium]|nr:lysophospholipid acyltransferase family protein [Gammaproteobacteria bacterium]
MSNVIPLNARDFLAPRYWPLWLAFGILRLISMLPMRWTQAIGTGLGVLVYRLVPSRRRVARINIRQAYPDFDEAQIRALNIASFKNLGISVFEFAQAWWRDRDYMRSICKVEGKQHLDNALAEGKGVILLTGHFTTLEIGAMLIGLYTPLNGVYKKAHNPMFNAFMAHYRSTYGEELIENKNVRALLRGLRRGRATWFAPDQDFADQDIVFTPFLGGIASTLTATARMSEMTGAKVVPFYPQRLERGKGYRLVILPALEDFPTDDIENDSARINKAIEDMVYANPEQYGWVHKRFKHRPSGEAPIY